MTVYQQITNKKSEGNKQFAVLIDPDKSSIEKIEKLCMLATDSGVDYIFVGGSLLTNGNLPNCIRRIKYACNLPVVLFPGNGNQIDSQADAILFLSLISGRNPELLIGKHVVSAPIIREKNLEAISTGYMLIESGRPTTALYMSNTLPIPSDKPDIAACTAMAGELLGLKMIFLDAGSGASFPVNEQMIHAVRKSVEIPLIVGGGINTPEKAATACKAGADLIVVGNSIESDPGIIKEIADAVKTINVS
ncbi:MAG: geranylgeranylglyceryl/heptaprenylglyceryl phosphate synthase [Bacteroidia bacterium]|nr:geranylgeranylglyceryl/heptaprenylglyceryl phosphate synthase [Bacteroidota bacterium]MBP9083161.1 geranylgeranylglyceryl/heptaprenylglyceryl phosphate synthase [Bacteroidia bacterium]MBK8413406.1 geranylgeranylglyceryl/heptaprenylglyceryl phosphate synthase [Bacteroidota bacterium]MBK8876712.1 geranylgeranylglyceryl/heptaprenylglyceryl phosphate synthase [Bacteroidota bacterium]MBK9046317.1 geranylgeranylglyceryl/heptaprenylglyceryl phosphate synthase [Bacteroidota bacterium]